MTLRQGLGSDVQRIYEKVDDLLDSEDAIIILADAPRAERALDQVLAQSARCVQALRGP